MTHRITTLCHCADWRHAECHYAKCCYADCNYAECRGASQQSIYICNMSMNATHIAETLEGQSFQL
jgi:hypothetical protein